VRRTGLAQYQKLVYLDFGPEPCWPASTLLDWLFVFGIIRHGGPIWARALDADTAAIRRSTHTGRPLGTPEFIEALEKVMRRDVAPKKGGHPEKSPDDRNQSKFSFDL